MIEFKIIGLILTNSFYNLFNLDCQQMKLNYTLKIGLKPTVKNYRNI